MRLQVALAPPFCTLCIMMRKHTELLKHLIPLWYAEMAWAKELLVRAFQLERAEDILRPEFRGRRQIPGTTWFIRTHGIGVDVYKTLEVGGIDFDFDKPDPDAWRLRLFFEKQVNAGVLLYETYRELMEDEELLQKAITELLGQRYASREFQY